MYDLHVFEFSIVSSTFLKIDKNSDEYKYRYCVFTVFNNITTNFAPNGFRCRNDLQSLSRALSQWHAPNFF